MLLKITKQLYTYSIHDIASFRYQLMKHCWSVDTNERPQFPYMVGQLEMTLDRREFNMDLFYELGRTTIGSLAGSLGRASTASNFSKRSAASSRIYMVGANDRYLAAVPESVDPTNIEAFVNTM